MLVADRGAETRASLTAAFAKAGFVVCASCADAAETVTAAAAERPDVCVVDVDLPGGGLTAVRALAASSDPPRILVTAAAVRAEDLFGALRAGADGYVAKAFDPSELPAEVAALLRGDAALSRQFTACLIAEFRRQADTSTRKEETRCTH